MKRLTTYYFLLLACLNVFFALFLPFITNHYKMTVQDTLLEGRVLPLLTERVIQCSCWPWVGVAICVTGTILSLLGRLRDNVLTNLLIVFLIIELWVMFISLVAFNIPFINLFS